MNDYAKITAPDTIEIRRVLPGPIERIWAYLTEPEKRGQWLATGEMEERVGGKVHLHFHHADLTPHEESIPERFKSLEHGHDSYGRITRCDPPRLLSYTWGERSGVASEVVFALTPQDDEVLLVLTHRHLPDRETLIDVAGGWHTHLGILADRLNGRVPAPFWTTHAAFEREYQQRLR